MSVLFQWVDGGILRQFQLRKNTDCYRILMAVVSEIQQSIANEGQTDRIATNVCVLQPAEAVRRTEPISARNTRVLGNQPRETSATSRHNHQRTVQMRQNVGEQEVRLAQNEHSAGSTEQHAEEEDRIDYRLHFDYRSQKIRKKKGKTYWAVCNRCAQIVRRKDRNTTCMINHLLGHHPRVLSANQMKIAIKRCRKRRRHEDDYQSDESEDEEDPGSDYQLRSLQVGTRTEQSGP